MTLTQQNQLSTEIYDLYNLDRKAGSHGENAVEIERLSRKLMTAYSLELFDDAMEIAEELKGIYQKMEGENE